MSEFLYTIVQCLWALPQTLAGLVVFLIYRRYPHYRFQGAIVTECPTSGSVSLGLFVFVSSHQRFSCSENRLAFNAYERELLLHEYGHTIQSLVLGPLYLLIIGLPSALWANLPALVKLRKAGRDYDDFYTERSATRLGKRVAIRRGIMEKIAKK